MKDRFSFHLDKLSQLVNENANSKLINDFYYFILLKNKKSLINKCKLILKNIQFEYEMENCSLFEFGDKMEGLKVILFSNSKSISAYKQLLLGLNRAELEFLKEKKPQILKRNQELITEIIAFLTAGNGPLVGVCRELLLGNDGCGAGADGPNKGQDFSKINVGNALKMNFKDFDIFVGQVTSALSRNQNIISEVGEYLNGLANIDSHLASNTIASRSFRLLRDAGIHAFVLANHRIFDRKQSFGLWLLKHHKIDLNEFKVDLARLVDYKCGKIVDLSSIVVPKEPSPHMLDAVDRTIQTVLDLDPQLIMEAILFTINELFQDKVNETEIAIFNCPGVYEQLPEPQYRTKQEREDAELRRKLGKRTREEELALQQIIEKESKIKEKLSLIKLKQQQALQLIKLAVRTTTIQYIPRIMDILVIEYQTNRLLNSDILHTLHYIFNYFDIKVPIEYLVQEVDSSILAEFIAEFIVSPVNLILAFPVFNHIFRSKNTDLIVETADILFENTGIQSNIPLPLVDILRILMKLASEYPVTRIKARQAVSDLCSRICDDYESLKLDKNQLQLIVGVLVDSLQHKEDAVRGCAISGILELPLLESLESTLEVALWVSRFDIMQDNAQEAVYVWEELQFGEAISPELVPMILPYVQHQYQEIRLAAGNAMAEALLKYEHLVPTILELLIKEYENNKPKGVQYDKFGMVIPGTEIEEWHQRMGIATALKSSANAVYRKESTLRVLEFLVDNGPLADSNAKVRNEFIETGLVLIKQSSQYTPDILDLLNRDVSNPTLKENMVILMGTVAQYLKPEDPKIVQTIETLLDMELLPEQEIQIAAAKCIGPLIKIDKTRVGTYIERMIDQAFKHETFEGRRGGAFGLAGLVKGAGVGSLKQYNIMTTLSQAMAQRDLKKKQGALFIYEALAELLGRMFEPYVVQVLPQILVAYGDSNGDIREAGEQTSRVIMSKLSAHCVKLLLPSLLTALEEKNFRSKVGAIEVISSMTSMAPKQLSASLPTIVPKICEILGDSHVKVQKAAVAALVEFGKVIKNPEISELVPILIKALTNPNEETLKALKALLDTRFVHYIDAPSLALLVPIISRGMKERSAETKKKAAEIMGNMATMTNPADLVPYLPGLVPLLKEVLVDPVPETRATAAKAFGSLVHQLGEERFPGIIDELLDLLDCDVSAVDRSGAAQGLSEILAGVGIDRLEEMLPFIIESGKSTKPTTREGFTMLLEFLPYTFKQDFAPFIGGIVPTMLIGLADEHEAVRESALRVGRVIVSNYASSAIDLLLPELEKGMFDDNWRIRQNSVQLIGDLVFRLAGISNQVQLDDNDELEGSGAEKHRSSLKKALGDKFEPLLASLFMTRADVSGLVRQCSIGVWKAIVTNTQKTLKEILPTLMNMLLTSLASESEEKRAISGRTLGDLVRRLGDSVLSLVQPILLKGLSSREVAAREGVCIGLSEIIAGSGRNVEEIAEQCIPLIKAALVDSEGEVRAAAAETFDVLFDRIGRNAIDLIIPDLLNQLQTVPAALEGLKVIMAVRSSSVFPVLIPTLLTKPITAFNAKALGALIAVSGDALKPKISNIVLSLIQEICTGSAATIEIMESLKQIMVSASDDGVRIILLILIEILVEGETLKKTIACKCLDEFFISNTNDIREYSGDLLELLVGLFSQTDEDLLESSLKAFESLVQRIGKDEIDKQVKCLQKGISRAASYLNDNEEIAALNRPKALKSILSILLTGLTTGGNEAREIAAYSIGDLISRSSTSALKPYVTQITGPLIRVVGDRFPPNVKTGILSSLCLLLGKVPLLLKPFLPQLQRTFVKSLSDSGSSVKMREKTADCLSLLIPLQPKLDPLVVELVNSIKNLGESDSESIWNALFSVIQTAKSNLNSTSVDSIMSIVVPNLKGEDSDTLNKKGAALCFGALCQYQDGEEATNTAKYQRLTRELIAGIDHSEWTEMHGAILALQSAFTASKDIFANESLNILVKELVLEALNSPIEPLVESAVKLSGKLIMEGIYPSVLCLALLPKTSPQFEMIKARREAIIIFKNVAASNHELITPFINELVAALMLSVRDRTISIKLASERALLHVLKIREGNSILDEFVKTLDAQKARSISDYAKRVLVKIAQKDSDLEDM